MTDNRKTVDKLKARLTEIESQKGFDKTSPFYLALKEKVSKLDKLIEK